ncbi:MAG: phospholipase D family protein [Fusobacteriota bacterium]
MRKNTLLGLLILFNLGCRGLPKGISVETPVRRTSNVEFLNDITYIKDGKRVHEQEIFENIFTIIDEAKEYIIIDMFLYNNYYDKGDSFIDLSRQLTDSLIEAKNREENIEIIVISDEINNFYGSYENEMFRRLKENDIEVIITDLNKLKDSNKLWSSIWKVFFQWFGTSGNGWLPNPFTDNAPKVTLRSYLKLLNFKANHRKVVITDKKAIVTSGNPHDASSYHSNIAFILEGKILGDLLDTERAVAKLSGSDLNGVKYKKQNKPENISKDITKNFKVKVITEGKIRESVIREISDCKKGDKINLGMFYIADRKIIKEFKKASNRGVEIKMILDPNKDAFGREKPGIPNRQVAYELKKETDIKIRWANTKGEQFHTKYIYIEKNNESIVIGGSANYTRRNIGDYNLETNLKISVPKDIEFTKEVTESFDRLWNNKEGIYTVDYSKFEDKSKFKYWVYRFQEWSGLSTF